ncbi:MAG: hypothetical protein KA190_28625 [Kofleriaceae bacterium]|nr:hypothetical protein [Kofleriaceae bacterium]
MATGPSSCPVCARAVDPLRAPAVRVEGGRVIAYCSSACADKAAAPAAPAGGGHTTRGAAPAPSTSAAPRVAGAVRASTGPVVAGAPAAPSRPDPSGGTVVTIEVDDDSGPATVGSQRAITGTIDADTRASSADAGGTTTGSGRGRGRLIALGAGTIVAGGLAVAVVSAMAPSRPARTAATDAVADPAVLPVDAPPPLTAEVLATRARAVLSETMATAPPRVRRIAAAALARTGDAGARDVLFALLTDETSDINRIGIGYALARAGDARGSELLRGYLTSPRRDVRADAAGALLAVGDDAGRKVMTSFLALSSHRLSAAAALARRQDPDALAALDALRADASASAEDKVRATIALARGGRAEVAAELAGTLGDDRHNAAAAIALAGLRDGAARPVLLRQLTLPSLRVGAAVALRRLEATFDVAPLLSQLDEALTTGKDVDRVDVAEAILILTGPAAWAEYD